MLLPYIGRTESTTFAVNDNKFGYNLNLNYLY